MKKIQDFYFKKAKKEGFPARSVYKLKEAKERYGFLSQGQRVLELGAYPGSWTKYSAQLVGGKGRVVAVDLEAMGNLPGNVSFLRADIFEVDPLTLKGILSAFDVVLSDMAPKTSGVKEADHLRSIALAERAFYLAVELLNAGGSFFCKIFQGRDFPGFIKRCKIHFRFVKVVKPKSSRSESVEAFVLCTGFRQ